MCEQGRSPRRGTSRPDGRHLIHSATIATELVELASVCVDDHVLEIGAGTGRLTEPLAACAGHVTAIELDPFFAEELRRRFRRDPHVDVLEADVLRARLPSSEYRAFGNVPFAITAALLRRLLDDVGGPLARADLLLQLGAARTYATVWPGRLRTIGWLPWWEPTLVRRISRSAFEPPPSVDAAMLTIKRRPMPLVPAEARPGFVAFVRRAFRHGSWPVRRSLRDRLPERAWKRLARERGIHVDALPRDLDVSDWIAAWRVDGQQAPRAKAQSVRRR